MAFCSNSLTHHIIYQPFKWYTDPMIRRSIFNKSHGMMKISGEYLSREVSAAKMYQSNTGEGKRQKESEHIRNGSENGARGKGGIYPKAFEE